MKPEELKTIIHKNLKAIREILDADVTSCDISSVVEKTKLLTQLSGLAAETKAQSVKLLQLKKLEVLIKKKDENLSPSILSK